jgi:hypothetical protein
MFNVTSNRRAAAVPRPSKAASLGPRGLGQTARRLSLFGALGGLLLGLCSPALGGGKPDIDLTYFNGQVYYMIGPKMITNPNPNLLAQAEELYMVAYPINPDGLTDLGPLTLPSGYQPTCNPCFRPGMMPQFGYHDHIVGGVPGQGKNGTAGVYEGPWKIILLMYNPEVAFSPDFTPITSAADLDAAEAAGEFMPINSDLNKGPNPYEIETGKVLICPLVSPHA